MDKERAHTCGVDGEVGEWGKAKTWESVEIGKAYNTKESGPYNVLCRAHMHSLSASSQQFGQYPNPFPLDQTNPTLKILKMKSVIFH